MKTDNPFDKKLEAQHRQLPGAMHDALVEAVDTLDIVWAGVQAVFEDAAKPELAVSLLPVVLQLEASKRQQRDAEFRARMEGER